MDVQHAPGLRQADAAPSWNAEPLTAPLPSTHAGPLDGASLTGEAARRQASVRVGLWLDDAGRVRRARFRVLGDDGLRALAESACVLLETVEDPLSLDGERLRRVAAAGQAQGERAELVAAAVHAALMLRAP